MADNPKLSAEFIAAQKRLYRGFSYKRFIEGQWIMAEGVIHKDSWSEELLYNEGEESVTLPELPEIQLDSFPIQSGNGTPGREKPLQLNGETY